jgi:hypothetical protein
MEQESTVPSSSRILWWQADISSSEICAAVLPLKMKMSSSTFSRAAFTASKYLRSLRPDLRNRVELKYSELPDTLEAVHVAALDAEYALTNRGFKPPAPPHINL